MIDRTIPYYNMILRCDNYIAAPVSLPADFSIVSYQNGFEKSWAELEFNIGDFDSISEAENYFKEKYLTSATLLSNILFLLDAKQNVIGSCIAWFDNRNNTEVSSLHWLIVDEKYQGLGLGRSLCQETMNVFSNQKLLPVYAHTQPWSWRAILLYISLGFKIQKVDSFSDFVNQYDDAMATLKKIVLPEQYELLKSASE